MRTTTVWDFRKVAAVTFLIVGLSACGGGGGSGPVDPADADAVTQRLEVKIGANDAATVLGDLPETTEGPLAPVADATKSSEEVEAGQITDVELNITLAPNATLERLFAKVVGAGSYFDVEVPATSKQKISVAGKATSAVMLSIRVPARIGAGQFCLDIKAQDDQLRTSNAERFCVVIPEPPTSTPSATPTPSQGASPSPSATPSSQPTPTQSPTATPTATSTATPTPTPANARPVADAGESRRVIEGTTVVLDGGESSDSDGDALSYAWTGPVALTGANTRTPSFLAPNVNLFDDLDFRLVVTDARGLSSQAATVRIEVSDDTSNLRFIWPVGGTHGPDYAVTSYYDQDSEPNIVRDYRGGGRSYDQAQFCAVVDARLSTYRQANEGTAVYAMARGEVVEIFEGYPNVPNSPCIGESPVANYVAVRHAGGYLTSYSSLTDIRVSVGQSVTTATVLGLVGTTFCEFPAPGLFAYLLKNDDVYGSRPLLNVLCTDVADAIVDPFAAGLWAAQPRQAPAYDIPAAIMDIAVEVGGFGDPDVDVAAYLADIRDVPAVNDTTVPLGDLVGTVVWLSGGLAGETIAIRYTTPTRTLDEFVPVDLAQLSESNAPIPPADWYYTVVADEIGTWQVEVLLNNVVAFTHVFNVTNSSKRATSANGSMGGSRASGASPISVKRNLVPK